MTPQPKWQENKRVQWFIIPQIHTESSVLLTLYFSIVDEIGTISFFRISHWTLRKKNTLNYQRKFYVRVSFDNPPFPDQLFNCQHTTAFWTQHKGQILTTTCPRINTVLNVKFIMCAMEGYSPVVSRVWRKAWCTSYVLIMYTTDAIVLTQSAFVTICGWMEIVINRWNCVPKLSGKCITNGNSTACWARYY
jgi:hypothetical protein